jgi:hypothetical protein
MPDCGKHMQSVCPLKAFDLLEEEAHPVVLGERIVQRPYEV